MAWSPDMNCARMLSFSSSGNMRLVDASTASRPFNSCIGPLKCTSGCNWAATPSRSFRDQASRYNAQRDSMDFDMLIAPDLETCDQAGRVAMSALPARNRIERRSSGVFISILVCYVEQGSIEGTDSQVWTKRILSILATGSSPTAFALS